MASILLLEDDDLLRDNLVDLLSQYQHTVSQASSAEEAVALARKQPFHLLLSDVRVAGDRDGVSALEEVQRLQPNIRSIIMTGYADRDVPLRAARLKADDYIFKPFKLQQMIASVKSVLERETPFRSVFQRMVQAPQQAHQKAMRWLYDSHFQKLNETRENCVKQFFLLLRSKHYNEDHAYRLFAHWEGLELTYLKLSEPKLCGELTEAYRKFEEFLLKGELPQTRASSVSRAQFVELQSRIQAGKVDWLHLLKAFALLHSDEVRRESLENHCIAHWLWSQSQDGEDPLLGLKVGDYTLKSRRSGEASGIRLYEAVREGGASGVTLILAVPEEEAASPLVQSELEMERARFLTQALQHVFLLYRSQALSLLAQLPPGGSSPQQAWNWLRPVFLQVEGYHQQGLYSGYFALQDIDCLPGQPCRLANFSDRGYREQHRNLNQGGGLVMNFFSAPEVDEIPLPTAASDQAVLGRILFEVIFAGYPKPETRLHLRFLGTPQANEHFRPYIARLEPLARAFYRLCHQDPGQRFPNLREAIQTLDQLLGTPS